MRTLIALFVVSLAVTLASTRCEARGPCSLRGHRASHAGHYAGHVYTTPYPTHAGYLAPVPKSSYAYGWFGVQPRKHKGVHYGYYNNYKQWSYR